VEISGIVAIVARKSQGSERRLLEDAYWERPTGRRLLENASWKTLRENPTGMRILQKLTARELTGQTRGKAGS